MASEGQFQHLLFSFLFPRTSCCVSETEALKAKMYDWEHGIGSLHIFKTPVWNKLFLFKLPYHCSEFISYMIPQDWILLSQLQAGNSLVLCANDWFSQSVATWLPGLFEVPAIAKLLTVAYFSLPSVSTPLLSSMNTMNALVECVGTSPWILLHTNSLLSRLHVPQVFSAGKTRKSSLETCQISADRA